MGSKKERENEGGRGGYCIVTLLLQKKRTTVAKSEQNQMQTVQGQPKKNYSNSATIFFLLWFGFSTGRLGNEHVNICKNDQ